MQYTSFKVMVYVAALTFSTTNIRAEQPGVADAIRHEGAQAVFDGLRAIVEERDQQRRCESDHLPSEEHQIEAAGARRADLDGDGALGIEH